MAKYIDAEVAVETFRLWFERIGTKPSFEDVQTIIQQVPAADVKPVVHGRWDGNNCTHCQLPWNYNMVQGADDWGYFDPMPDFCPNCGAHMDGEA